MTKSTALERFLALILIATVLAAISAFVGGLVVYFIWQVFNLTEIVVISYMQAVGIALILSMFSGVVANSRN